MSWKVPDRHNIIRRSLYRHEEPKLLRSSFELLTSRLPSCAVQELKIRRPNYSDFSVKTMVIMKLFQQQNGNTCFIIVLKVSFMGKYANYSIKEMKWRIKTILFYFIFPFIKYKHCNIVTILSVRGRLILSSCTAHEISRLVRGRLGRGACHRVSGCHHVVSRGCHVTADVTAGHQSTVQYWQTVCVCLWSGLLKWNINWMQILRLHQATPGHAATAINTSPTILDNCSTPVPWIKHLARSPSLFPLDTL